MGNHKKKSKRHSRSRSRSSDDHQSRKKSRKTRRRSSSSSSSDSARRHGRSSKPSRHRSRSPSPSRRRSRSRSREDRRRHRRSRSNSRSRRSHSRRRSRSRSRSRERRRRSHSGSRSRHSSRKCSPTERDKLKGKQAKDEKTSSDPAPSNMLKVKMQKALEDATGSTISTESTVTKKCVDEDNPEMRKELKRLEKDSFRQTAFKSSRWDLNAPKPSFLTSRPMSIDQSHDSAIFGGSAMNGSTHQTLQHPNVAAILYRPNWKLTCESLRASPKEKMDRWIDKLQMWRKKRIDEAECT